MGACVDLPWPRRAPARNRLSSRLGAGTALCGFRAAASATLPACDATPLTARAARVVAVRTGALAEPVPYLVRSPMRERSDMLQLHAVPTCIANSLIELKTASPRRPRLEVLGRTKPNCQLPGALGQVQFRRCLLIRCPTMLESCIMMLVVECRNPQTLAILRKLPAALWALWPSNSPLESTQHSAVLARILESRRASQFTALIAECPEIRCRERRVGREECRVVGNVNPATPKTGTDIYSMQNRCLALVRGGSY